MIQRPPRSTLCPYTTRSRSGPVHLNLPFREPLLPEDADVRTTGPWAGRPDGAPWTDGSVPAPARSADAGPARTLVVVGDAPCGDRKSTRLNSSHANISYAVF